MLLFFFSCKGNAEKNMILNLSEINGQTSLDEIYKDFEYISLETSENNIFGAIDKLIVYDNKYFILDKTRMKKIYVFHEDGAFSHTIGETGSGPGEYTSIEDFTIDMEKKQLVILTYPSTVFIYNLNGDFIRKQHLTSNSMLWNIVSYTDGYVCSTNQQSAINDKLLFVFDKEFVLKNETLEPLPFQIAFPPFVSTPLQLVGSQIYYFDNFTSTLYVDATNQSECDIVQFSFEEQVSGEIFKDVQQFFMNQHEYCFFTDAIVADNVLYATFINKGKQCDLRFNLQTKESKISYAEGWRPKALFYHGSSFYSSVSPSMILEGDNLFEAKLITRFPIEIDSNPVILKYKAKSRS